MTKREANSGRVRRLLARIGRIRTGVIMERLPRHDVYGVETDGDGIRAEFGCPRIFWDLAGLEERVKMEEELRGERG